MQNSFLLIAAGSETTSTQLAATTYFLLTNPVYYAKVAAEVRASFSSISDITLVSVSKLSWMLACLKEANRLFPPLASWLPRRLVKGDAVVAGHPVPQGVRGFPFLFFSFSFCLYYSWFARCSTAR